MMPVSLNCLCLNSYFHIDNIVAYLSKKPKIKDNRLNVNLLNLKSEFTLKNLLTQYVLTRIICAAVETTVFRNKLSC